MEGVVVTLGEIMGRVNPPGFQRFGQAMPGRLEISFAGSEANVAVSVVRLGGRSRFVTALPANPIGHACVDSLRSYGVDVSRVVRLQSGRMGLYFVEKGANQRPSKVVYDRWGSSVSLAGPDAYDWDAVFEGACWFHTSGITPAISRQAAQTALEAVRQASSRGCPVSCDLNFRGRLWKWEDGMSERELARRTMAQILPHVNLVIGNEQDAEDVLGIRAGASDVDAGELEIERYPDVARQIADRFDGVTRVGITLRESISASHNNWGAMLYEAETDEAHFAPVADGRYRPYQIRNIVDRVGAGDAFAAALIYALNSEDFASPATTVGFATAASCLAHSVEGDFNLNSRQEVEALMAGSGSGRVVR